MNQIFLENKTVKSIYRKLRYLINRIQLHGKQKIFGIGANKTGTTSLRTAMIELGFIVGNQSQAVALIDDWAKRDFSSLIKYCENANFFQDIPFSLDYTYVIMDQAFKGSKFILTIRDSPEQWYESVIRFESKLWGRNGNLPTKQDLQESTHIEKGRLWHINRLIHDTPEEDLYNKEMRMQRYIRHNESVKNYFRQRPDDLLVINVSEENSYDQLCEFLGVEKRRDSFPWKNRTTEI